jgi:pilus assembly protein CpaC
MSSRNLKLILALICVVGVAAALAAPRVDAAPKSAAAALQTTSVDNPVDNPADNKDIRILTVSMNKMRSIRLPVKVSDVVIADPTIADIVVKKQDLVFVFARSVGATVVYFIDEAGDIVLKTEVRVQLDIKGIEDALEELIPEADIKVAAFRNGVFLSGVVTSASEATNAEDITRRFVGANTDINNMLKLRGEQQVVLQVRVAEVLRTVRKNLAIRQPFSSQVGGLTVNAVDFNLFNAATDFFTAGNIDIFGDAGVFGLGLGPAAFRILEENGMAKTLAEPMLTAISGETANFLAGGEFPFPSGQDDNGNISIEFRDFGISLNFTPVVLDKGRIRLQVSTEISNISNANGLTILGGNFIPGIATRRTDTTVELPSGGTIMLSGLMQVDDTNVVRGAPYLKDIPVLGALFRSTEFAQNHTELLIIVTAYLAKSSDGADKLSMPTDGFPPASDVDLYMLGKLHGEYMDEKTPVTGIPLAGPFGYIME